MDWVRFYRGHPLSDIHPKQRGGWDDLLTSMYISFLFLFAACPGGNATDPIWRVLVSFDGISSWTPLKPQYSNSKPNPNPLADQLWCSDFLTPPTTLIILHRLPAFLESLMPLRNWCSIHARWSKSSLKHSIRFCGIFSKFKTESYCISFFLTSRLHFWNSPALTIRPL